MKRYFTILLTSITALVFSGCGATNKVVGAFHGINRGIGNAAKKVTPKFGDDNSSESNPAEAIENGTVLFTEGEKVYFVIEEGGQRRERGYFILSRSSYAGKPCIVRERRRFKLIERDGRRFSTEIRQTTTTGADGSALRSETKTITGSESFVEQVTIRHGKATFEKWGSDGIPPKKRRIDVPKDIMFGIEPDWILARNPQKGKTYRADVLTSEGQIIEETCAVIGRGKETVFGTPVEVWIASCSRGGGNPTTMTFTDNGEMLRLQADNITYRVVTKSEYDMKRDPFKRVTSIPLDFDLPAWDTYMQVTYEVSPANDWIKYLKDRTYSTSEMNGGHLLVSLKSVPPRDAIGSRLPMKIPPEMQNYLAHTGNIMPRHPVIAKIARDRIAGENRTLYALANIAGYVHSKVRYSSGASINQTPLSTLKSMRGDCSEHADLFASIARAAGIPTRHCQGLIFRDKKAVYHVWNEAWVDGSWIPVDTTTNRVGLPAGYLLTSRGTGDGVPRDEFAWRMSQGGLSISLKSATRYYLTKRHKHMVIPSQRNTYITNVDNWLANTYWGFAIELPQGYKGNAQFDKVSINSPGDKAPLRVEISATRTKTVASEATLAKLENSMRKQYIDFKLHQSSIIDLPTGPKLGRGKRSTSVAIFMDFSCRIGKSNLRCRQYIIPKDGRTYRIWIVTTEKYNVRVLPEINNILATFEL